MTATPIRLAGASLVPRPSGALWWPAMRLLCVADLHLGRSERLARRGGALLPPYETAATLDRLAAELAALAPSSVVCLGDSFDDCAAGAALPASERDRLTALIAGRDWTWIAGNHDPAPLACPGPAPRRARASARSSSVTRHSRRRRPARSRATGTRSCGSRCAAAPSAGPASSPTRCG